MVDGVVIDELHSRCSAAEAKLVQIRPLKRVTTGKRCGRKYPDWFYMTALAIVGTAATPRIIRTKLRIIQTTWLPFFSYAEFEIPGERWWRQLRLKLLTANKLLNAYAISGVKRISDGRGRKRD